MIALRLLKFKLRKQTKKYQEDFNQFNQRDLTQEAQEKNEKIIPSDEGEYVDFEEIE